ncbi:CoxG family protein [Antarcticimicrobium sediminis]|uniref:Carbon monoxide dehydrogenase n=1 Tax=Antarcticimicrobium sediminis TaxID=2546227 RepID=A0A4R5EHF9_9RHOB|nr:carbon monoxide dehydrogenase subunit G [Antarcticimicrobium sediminis]TDE33727.1 carbon monoxide dehydrogenase [Antarcticimicrobium sediminis]
MELNDQITINAPMARVYAALNDPEILRHCIPGCEELTQLSDTELQAKILLKVGPVKARFSGDVQLDKSGAPDAFSLTGQGNGGVAGHATGGADVTLIADGETTILTYDAKAKIGGKLAQLGSRLIQSTSKKLAAKFFQSFAEALDAEKVG